jgi:hypothetical protein
VEALRASGWFVRDTSRLPLFVDAVCARRGRLELVEIKSAKGKLNPEQESFHQHLANCGVIVKVLRSVEDAVRL